MSPLTRVTVLVAVCAMFFVLREPIWRIELTAPQYPEGLTLQIYANRIGGDVDIVNGLNHYIGMHTLHTRDFVEFIVLPYIIGGFAVIGLFVALFNRKSLFYGWVGLFLLIAFTSMIDFYRWEYNYGHNLDPAAPIQVPGMAYQPPLLGFKQLLNFGAYSIPDSGGWLFVGAGLVLAAATFIEVRKKWKGGRTRTLTAMKRATALFAVLMVFFSLTGCGHGPQPIQYGQDNCAFCKMTFTDHRFGAEVRTVKGKVFKYDDVHCLLSALSAGLPEKKDIASIWFVNFITGGWIPSDRSFLLQSESFHTPMDGNIAAFPNNDSRAAIQQQLNGKLLTWNDIYR